MRRRPASQVVSLSQRHELARDSQLEVVERARELLGSKELESLDVLLARRGVARVNRRRRGQQPVLDREPDDRLVQRDHSRLPARVDRELLGEAAGEARVEEAVQPLLDEVRQVRDADREPVERYRDRRGVEAPARVRALGLVALGGEDERGVRHRSESTLEPRLEAVELVENRPVHLGHDPEGRGRLELVLERGAPREELDETLVDTKLRRIPRELADPRRIRPGRRSDERDRERGVEVGVLQQLPGTIAVVDPESGRERGSVEEGRSFLRLRLVRRDAPPGERIRRRYRVVALEHDAFADEGLEEVSERRDLSRGAVRPGRHDRAPAVVQAIGEKAAEAWKPPPRIRSGSPRDAGAACRG